MGIEAAGARRRLRPLRRGSRTVARADRMGAASRHASLDDVYELVGTGVATQEAVPAAFAIAARSPGGPVAGLPDSPRASAATATRSRR